MSKSEINKAVKAHDAREMIASMENYKKLDKVKMDNPSMAKQYMETTSILDCRLIFSIRTEMVELKDNRRNMFKGSTDCEACDGKIAESQALS